MHTRSERIYRMYVSYTYHIHTHTHTIRFWTCCYWGFYCCCCHCHTIHCLELVWTGRHAQSVCVVFVIYLLCESWFIFLIFFLVVFHRERMSGWLGGKENCAEKLHLFFIVILDRKVNHILSEDTCVVNVFFLHILISLHVLNSYLHTVRYRALLSCNTIPFIFISFHSMYARICVRDVFLWFYIIFSIKSLIARVN